MTLSERIRISEIQDEYERETGERPSRVVAAVLLDREADARFHREQATGSPELFGAAPRSTRADVRNPILKLPAAEKIRALDPETRGVLAELLREIGADANAKAETSWKKGKAPMAAYWKAAGVYARHIARALEKSAQQNGTRSR